MTTERFDSQPLTSIRQDGLQNLTTGLGVSGHDPTLGYQITPFYPLLQQTQSRWVRQFKLCQKVVQIIPDTMTESWGQFTLGGKTGDDKLVQWVTQKLNEINGYNAFIELQGLAAGFNTAMCRANQSGNAAIALLINDGGTLKDPVDEKRIKSIDGFLVFDRWEILPELSGFYANGRITHYRQVGHTQLIDKYGNRLISHSELIHSDRILWFRGQEILDKWELLSNYGCDDSVLDSFVAAFTDYYASIRGMARMAVDYDARIHKIAGLMSGLEAGGRQAQDNYASRVRQFHQQFSLYRVGIIDKDLEEIDAITRNVAGYDTLAGKLLDWCLSNTDLFAYELLGQQVNRSGLADTGKAEQENANRRTSRFQSKKFDTNIRKLIRYLLLSKESPVQSEPESWGWQWNPLYPVSPPEQAELELQRSQIVSTLAAVDPTGTVAPAAILAYYGGEKYNPNITLPKEAIKALEDAIKNPQAAGGMPGEEPPVEGEESPTEEDGLGEDQQASLDDLISQVEAGEVEPQDAVNQAAETLGVDPAEVADYLGVNLDSQINLTPPPEVRKAFKKGLEAYEKYGGDGLEPATIREAKSIAAGKPVTVAKLKKAYRWFAGNSRFASYPDGTPAKVSWLLRGGKAFQGWVNQKVKELEDAERSDAVRPSCWDCVTKHLSASAILMEEADRDYPEHKFLAIGHLTQAEEEINNVAPAIAAQIRDIRKEYMRTGESPDYRVFVDLLKQAGIWSANFDSQKCGNSYISTGDTCHKGKSSLKETGKHLAEHLGANVASWSVGKTVGGAIANIATSHGFPPEATKLFSEATVQALTATAIHAAKPKNRKSGELAKKFVSEFAGATVGKLAHVEAEDDHVKAIIGAAIAGKSAGAATTAGVGAILKRGEKALNRVLGNQRRADSNNDADPGNTIQLSKQDQEAIFDLCLLGYGQIMSDRPNLDAFPKFKKVVKVGPVRIGVTHEPGDLRFPNSFPMSASYGMVMGSYGQAADKKAHDVYLGDDSKSDRLFKVTQVTPEGEFDEFKYIAHCPDIATARDLYKRHCPDRFGMIQAADWEEISPKKFDAAGDDAQDEPEPEYQEVVDQWQDVAPRGFDGILEAQDKDESLAAGIAAGILLAAWLFDAKRGIYLKPKTRKPLAPTHLEALAESVIAGSKSRLSDIHGQGLSDRQWQSQAWSEISFLHQVSFALGRGGFQQMTDKDRAKLQELLDFQFEHLEQFAKERGGLSDAQSLARLLMYAQAGYQSFKAGEHQAAIARGMKKSRRVLDPQANHCRQCPEYAAMGWGPIEKAILPGQDCDCMSNCRCTLEFK